MDESPLTFPCDYPIKVMGPHTPEFRAAVLAVLTAEAGGAEPRITERLSREGAYVSLTCTVRVASRAQLDGLYRRLHATGVVRYAL